MKSGKRVRGLAGQEKEWGASILKRSTNTISRCRLKDTTVVRLDDDKNFYQLTGVAADFWNLLDGKKSVSSICTQLVRKHRAPQDKVHRGAQKLVRDLIEHQLVERCDG